MNHNETQEKLVLWDVAGVDGLQVMKRVFGEQSDRIAPFQSLETDLHGLPCSVLRLCEGNFRICCPEKICCPENRETLPGALRAAAANCRVWVKQFPWLTAMLLPEEMSLAALAEIARPKPPFHLKALALNCAAPARIEGIAVLVWRHPRQGKERLELHLAQTQWKRVETLVTQHIS
ncbi:MAG TPA: hypothetical protein IGS37_03595 [Synechococcales cyanobacterium M55_K2018_004]|nr:hypothetical protein [Synechococcales cyanobacterium M55_K2018_004]